MTRLFLIEGTWGGAWALNAASGVDSFRVFLQQQGFDCHRVIWSFDVDGIPSVSRHAGEGHRDWIAGGYGLRYRLRDVPLKDRNILLHSHGIGVVLEELTVDEDPDDPIVPINRLLSVCSPPRSDMETLGQLALDSGALGAWRHLYADGWDKWARLGQMFDGHWGWRRDWNITHPQFQQLGEKDVGHSGLFDADKRQRFVDHGHFAFLQGPVVMPRPAAV